MKKLYRSATDKKIFGICGGLANTLEMDPTIIRLIFALLFILTGFFPVGLFYIIAKFLMPISNEETISNSEQK